MKNLAYFVLVAAAVAGIWFGGRHLAIDRTWVLVAMVSVALLAVIGFLVVKLLAIRRAAAIEAQLKSPEANQAVPGTGEQNLAARKQMEEQFQRYLEGLKASPTGRSALATLPWYLVIGAPGSGKTTALQESGLAFSSMGHGLRSIRGIGGTRDCDWWFTDTAIFLDTAGRYTTQTEDQEEWLSFLDLVKQTRKGRALNGIVVVVSVSDLIKTDAASLAITVRPIRERIAEVSQRLHLVLPVYVVFSKADLIGGFKDFFATLSRVDRDQVWGCTLDRADLEGRTPREAYADHVSRILPALQSRRLAALTSLKGSAAQLAKTCLFPGNFVAAQKWMTEFIGELFQPSPLPDQPIFRGFYYTSGIQAASKVAAGAAAAAASAAAAQPVGPRTEHSIFFEPGANAPQPEATVDTRRGFFLKDLFSQVIIGDHGLAGLPKRLIRRRHALRAVSVYGSICAGILLLASMLVGFARDQHEIDRAVASCADLITAQRAIPESDEAVAAALDSTRLLLAEVQARPSRASADLAHRVQEIYFPLVTKCYVDPAAAKMGTDLEDMRRAAGKTLTTYDELFDVLRAYQMLGAAIPCDRQLLDTELKEGYWFSAFPTPLAPDVERRGLRHLAYLLDVMPTSVGWQARIDGALVERLKSSLGDALWTQQSYVDALSAVEGGMRKVDRDAIVGGDNRNLLVADGEFSAVFTRDGWENVFKAVVNDKAEALSRRYRDLQIERAPDEIRRRLRALFARDYNAHWLKLVGSLRPAPFKDVAEASVRLRVLAGQDSPYLDLGKSLRAAAALHFDDADSRIHVPEDDKWLLNGLTAVLDFQVAVDRYLASTPNGARAGNVPKLRELSAAADKAAEAIAAATATIDTEQARTACAGCLTNIVAAVHQALVGELGDELERTWEATVRKPVAEQLAGKYPLDVKSAVDAPLPAFSRVFNPKSGAFWSFVQQVEELRKIRFAGTDLLPVSLDYQRMMPLAQTMRDALFAGGGEEMSLAFALTLENREGVKDVNVAFGSQKFGLYDRPDRRTQIAWKQSDAAGAKLSIQLGTGQWMTKDQPAAGWGIIRLMRDGGPTPRIEGGQRLSWIFDAQSLGKVFSASALLESPALEAFLTSSFIQLPAKIVP
jgi:type VI secretion system protein ImpL